MQLTKLGSYLKARPSIMEEAREAKNRSCVVSGFKSSEHTRVASQPNIERLSSTKRESIDADKQKWWDYAPPKKNKPVPIPLNIGVQATSIKLTLRNFEEEKKKRKEEYLNRLQYAKNLSHAPITQGQKAAAKRVQKYMRGKLP
jgi:hypothetical protein